MFLDFLRYLQYRKKYHISRSFMFSGSGIVFCGKGQIICKEDGYISDFGYIKAEANTKVVIGRKCRLGKYLEIYTGNNLGDQDFALKSLKAKLADVLIGDYCWIGSHVFIREGVSLGLNSVVGSHSVVTHSFPNNVIIAGVPARIIRRKTLS